MGKSKKPTCENCRKLADLMLELIRMHNYRRAVLGDPTSEFDKLLHADKMIYKKEDEIKAFIGDNHADQAR